MTLKDKIAKQLFNYHEPGNKYDYEAKSEYLVLSNKILSLVKSEMKKGLPDEKDSPKGKDCRCCAHYSGECGCGADWSDNDGFNACRQHTLKRIDLL